MTAIATVNWQAIGTGVRVVVHGGDLESARSAVDDILASADLAYSRFRDDSEISRLNARAGQRVAISALLAEAIDVSLRAARLTGGAVDPTVGRAMRLIGYDATFERIRDGSGPIELRFEPIPGWQAVDLLPGRREIRVRAGVELDLGSTGKALAADQAAVAALAASGARGILVSLGGDIAVTGNPPDGGWKVLVAEDSEMPVDGPGEVIAIDQGAVATSSTTIRRWRRDDRTLHHLVDPRTGAPVASPWRTATVVAGNCVDANTAATAAIVMGEQSISWIETTGLTARLVSTVGEIVRLGGWPDPLDPTAVASTSPASGTASAAT